MIPLVSVIIPTYKRSNYIIRAINSVINQTYKNIEIIVVDDDKLNHEFSIATENKFKEFIRKGKVLYIKHNNNRGVSAARNTGIEKVQGKYIAFLGKKIFSYKKNILKHLKSFKKIFKKY